MFSSYQSNTQLTVAFELQLQKNMVMLVSICSYLKFTRCLRVSIAELKQQDPRQLGEEYIFFQVRVPHYSPPVKESREETEHVRLLEVGTNVAP